MCTVNQWQLFDLHNSQGNDMPSDPTPDTKLPTTLIKKPTRNVTPQHSHLTLPSYLLFKVQVSMCDQILKVSG